MEKRHARDGITGGLLSALVPLFTGQWWPGIMVVLGIAIGAGLVFRGRYLAGVVMAAIFFAIPLRTKTDIPWNIFGPMIRSGSAWWRRSRHLSCAKSERRSLATQTQILELA